MGMKSYYLFDNLTVHDPDLLAEYARGAAQTVAGHGGRYLAVAPTPEVLEGDPSLTAPVLIEFPSPDAASAWYTSAEYAPWKRLRQRACDNTAIRFEGIEEEPDDAR